MLTIETISSEYNLFLAAILTSNWIRIDIIRSWLQWLGQAKQFKWTCITEITSSHIVKSESKLWVKPLGQNNYNLVKKKIPGN